MSDGPVLVVDAGSASLKAGYAGDDAPATVIPSVAQKYPNGVEAIEEAMIQTNDFSAKSLHPIHRGAVKNWEQLEVLWKIMLDDIGITSSDTTSVLITEPPNAVAADRSKWAEMLFESFRVPSIYIANSSALSLFASGRTTGLVVECGAGITSSVPVFEGLALAHAATSIEYAGQDVSQHTREALEEQGIQIDMAYARMLKEKMAFVRPSAAPVTRGNKSQQQAANREPPAQAHFSLPDGTDVSVDSSLFSACMEDVFVNNNMEPAGLTAQALDSLQLCDESLQRDLSNNVIISGGTSMVAGFGDRLERDLQGLVAKSTNRSHRHMNIRVVPSSAHREAGYTSQRKIAAWIGGSIVASLDTFKQIKITRQEWEEDPDACVRAKYV